MIDVYLRELERELRFAGRRRRRILAEVRDHLLEASRHSAEEGAAIRQFGSARLIAARFRDELGEERARAAMLASGAVVAAVVFVSLLNPHLSDAPASIAWTLLTQVIFVAGGLTFVRFVLGVRERVLLVRGSGTAATAALALLAVQSASWLALAVVLPLVGLAVLSIVRAARLAGPSHPHDLRDDLAALEELASRKVPTLAWWSQPVVVRLRGLDPRTHPWRFGACVAIGAGLAGGAGHGVMEGGVPAVGQLPPAIAAGLVIASLEAAAALAGYAVLGRFLGIRPGYQSRPRR